jgi:hypothetical protein
LTPANNCQRGITEHFDDGTGIEAALRAVGELLAAEEKRVAIVVVGGASLNLLGLLERSTSDVDVIAQADQAAEGEYRLRHAVPFPRELESAIRTVARDFGLPENWLNSEVSLQWQAGLPPTTVADLTWRDYGNLRVGLVGRQTLISLKLFAAVDHVGESVHLQDLRSLKPSDNELQQAAEWVATQDMLPEFPRLINQVLDNVKSHRE